MKKKIRKVVTFDEFYYQLKLLYLFLLHAVCNNKRFKNKNFLYLIDIVCFVFDFILSFKYSPLKCPHTTRSLLSPIRRGWGRGDNSLTVHRRAILKVVKSMCNGIKKIKCTLMKCHTNINSTPFTQLPHKFSYIVAILGHNHFESPNMSIEEIISHFLTFLPVW
jgi:hypothetical protein